MAWTKVTAVTDRLIRQIVPSSVTVSRRKMSAIPAAFANGNLFIGCIRMTSSCACPKRIARGSAPSMANGSSSQ